MDALLQFKSLHPINKKVEIFTCGGYSGLTVDGKVINFDWDEMNGNSHIDEKGYLIIDVEQKKFSDAFDYEYKQLGVIISPKLLTSLELIEVSIDCYADADKDELVEMKLIKFEIGEYAFTSEQIEAYYQKENFDVGTVKEIIHYRLGERVGLFIDYIIAGGQVTVKHPIKDRIYVWCNDVVMNSKLPNTSQMEKYTGLAIKHENALGIEYIPQNNLPFNVLVDLIKKIPHDEWITMDTAIGNIFID